MKSVRVALTHVILALAILFNFLEAPVLLHASHLNLKEKCLSKSSFCLTSLPFDINQVQTILSH